MEIDIISLGCSKNLVDAERLTRRLAAAGHRVNFEPSEPHGKAVIINTCGFIGDAKEESIDAILNAVKLKSEGVYRRVAVMGCLSERYRNELPAEIGEVDDWYGKFDWDRIVTDSAGWGRKSISPQVCLPYDRTVTTPSHYTYLKIAEGCNRFCSFCAIPLITGRFHSRSIEEVVAETELLVSRGVKEFNVIAQDLSSYGLDIYGKMELPRLVDAISRVDGVEWIRLHYAYPAQFPTDILRVMAERPNVCHYLDIALQHINDTVLANMRRHITGEQTRELIARMREAVPDIHIRTTLMTGFPGETDEAFNELVDFVRDVRFERMGAFAYCEEEDTYGAKNFRDEIPEEVKQQRLDTIMELQESISQELQSAKVGTTQRVIVDGKEGDSYVCRTQYDSPEVDPVVLVNTDRKLNPGAFYDVTITEAYPFELMATL